MTPVSTDPPMMAKSTGEDAVRAAATGSRTPSPPVALNAPRMVHTESPIMPGRKTRPGTNGARDMAMSAAARDAHHSSGTTASPRRPAAETSTPRPVSTKTEIDSAAPSRPR